MNKKGWVQYEKAFNEMGLEYIPSVGNFITVDIGKDTGNVFEALLQQGVILRPLKPYNMPHHFRITIGRKEENERCIEALKKVAL